MRTRFQRIPWGRYACTLEVEETKITGEAIDVALRGTVKQKGLA